MTTFAHPAHPREITAAWLQAQIGGRIDEVSMAIIGQDRGFEGTVARFTLSGEGVPATLVAKIADPSEVRWYREASPVPVNLIPRYLGGAGSMLLIDDIGDLEPGDVLAGTTPERVLSVLAAMERVRAAFPTRLDWLPTWDGVDIARRETRLAEALPRLGAFVDVPEEIARLLAMLPGRLEHLRARLGEGRQGVIHRDLHLDNLFFDGDRPVLTDWQSVSWGPVALDVAHQLAELPSVEGRRSIEGAAWEEFGDDLALALVWYLIGGIDWVVYGSREGAHPRKLAVMDDMLGSGKLFAAARDWQAERVIRDLR